MRLKEKYQKEILPKLMSELGIKNKLAAPKLLKATVNVGVGRNSKEKAYVDMVLANVRAITGQKPIATKARKSISSFKVREGQIVGVATTLRGARLYDFVEKLVNVTFPRVRDFRGISQKNIDRQGNLTVGFKEQTAFPEVLAEESDNSHGLEISLTTSAKDSAAGLALFKALGFPFKAVGDEEKTIKQKSKKTIIIKKEKKDKK